MGDVIYLRYANRVCKDCGCTKALAASVARNDPMDIFTQVADCGRCGDRVEVARAPGLEDDGLVCDDCGQPDDTGLTPGTVRLPYNLGSGMVLLCTHCLARRDALAFAGAGDGAQA